MSKLMFALALVVAAACGGKKSAPATSNTAPDTGSAAVDPATPSVAPMTPDECTAKGGYVKGDIGDGQVACPAGEADLGRVNQGIEGAVCCQGPAGSAATPAP